MNPELNRQEIIDYYDHCQVDYELVWHLNTKMCMHYGYWDNDTANLREALVNMNKRVAVYAQVQQGDYVLDAGCGVGGSSIFLAKTFNCITKGITLSEKQVATCRDNAAKHGVSNQCSFEVQSYLATDFPDNTFDVVWGIESVCYAYDKADFLREAFRILKPGGRVIVADFFSSGVNEGTIESELMDKWTSTWAIKAYADEDEFWNKMNVTGFIACKKHDATSHVIKSIKRLYYSFFPGLPVTYISQALGMRNKIQTANTWSTYYQYKAFKKGLWKYLFYSAKKPL
ncbi:MAG: methyltransferase domain-containing protein [Bacteroidia bacterium]